MLKRLLMQLVIFSFVTIALQTIALAQQPNLPKEPNPAAPIPAPVEVIDQSIPATTNPQCNEIANQIAIMSETKTSTTVNPWEDLAWLQENLGKPKIAQNNDNIVYMWICRSPNNPPGMVMYFINKSVTPPRIMFQSMVCKIPDGCTGYGFERKGEVISGFKVKSSLFNN